MIVAHDKDNERKLAFITEKAEAPFFCPECKEPVLLRKGRIRVHHFAHKPPIRCRYGKGESHAHIKAKENIYKALSKRTEVTKLEIERRLDGARPDVSCYIGKKPVVIEIQQSSISIDDIERRTRIYKNLKCYVIWLILDSLPLDGDRISPKSWQKWLHSLAFGRVYYYFESSKVFAYHYEPHYSYVEESSWYDTDGDSHSAGGYNRKSTRYREANKWRDTLDIVDDFKAITRSSWQNDDLYIPASLLWMDNKKKWW